MQNKASNTTTIKPLIPSKLGYARNETQSQNIEIRDLKYKKSILVIVTKIYWNWTLNK
jgi:hypothetical protein